MPNFTLDFEVFCGTCGAGMCGETDTRESHRRGMPQATVNACSKCMENAKDEGRDEIRDGELAKALERIEELEEQLEEMKGALP